MNKIELRYLCWALIYTKRQYLYTGEIIRVNQQNIRSQIEKLRGFLNSVRV
jgi:hypothetical protein